MSALMSHFKPLWLPQIWSLNFDTCSLNERNDTNIKKLISTYNLRIYKQIFLPVWVSKLSFSKDGGKGLIQVPVSLVLLCLSNLSADETSDDPRCPEGLWVGCLTESLCLAPCSGTTTAFVLARLYWFWRTTVLLQLSCPKSSASLSFCWLPLSVCFDSFLFRILPLIFWFSSGLSEVGGFELVLCGFWAWGFTGTLSLILTSELWPAEFKHMYLQNEHWENHNAWIQKCLKQWKKLLVEHCSD